MPCANNVAILQALARGEVYYGLPNHYYLLNFKKTEAKFAVDQASFAPGDVGNLINVAGIGILATATHRDAAERFIRFVLSPTAQQYFASEVSEYPVIDNVMTNSRLVSRDELLKLAPHVTLDDLDDLDGTLALLRSVGTLDHCHHETTETATLVSHRPRPPRGAGGVGAHRLSGAARVRRGRCDAARVGFAPA